uniref:Uncharacterized protein n=1 Tax=Oryza brachyantha TaxID=4533 RepID=J3N282_ORYBR
MACVTMKAIMPRQWKCQMWLLLVWTWKCKVGFMPFLCRKMWGSWLQSVNFSFSSFWLCTVLYDGHPLVCSW